MKRISNINFFRFLCIFIICLYVFTIIIGKQYIKHINYNKFLLNTEYFTTSVDDIYKEYKMLNKVLINDDNIKSINDLLEQSEYVLEIKVEKEPLFYGQAIINNAKVIKIIKGNESSKISPGKTIRIYDLISSITNSYVNYYGGMTPLTSEYNYVVFLKKAPKPNINDTYIFASVKYGKFNITIQEPNILNNYMQGSLTVGDVKKYDYIQTNCESIGKVTCDTSVLEKYPKLKQELLKYTKTLINNDNNFMQ